MSIDEGSSYKDVLPMECDHCGSDANFFGKSKVLAPLWAAVQTELLTYRRLEEGEPWFSCKFDMACLEKSLEGGGPLNIALIQENMMNEFYDCGRFLHASPACACVNDVAAYYFSNMEDWNRSTFLPILEEVINPRSVTLHRMCLKLGVKDIGRTKNADNNVGTIGE